MNYKSIFIYITLIAVLFGCSAPLAPAPPAETESWEEARLFLSYATSRPTELTLSLADLMLDASDGRIYCNVYTGGRMGNDKQLMSAVQNGTISIVQCATSMQVSQVPEIALLDTPYLFKDIETCNEQLNHTLIDFFQPYYNRAGLQLISLSCASFRQLTSTIPVKSIDDFREIRIRTMDNKYHMAFWENLGAKVFPIAFSDLFYALQQGVVNAQENVPMAALSIGLDKVQNYMILTNHVPFVTAVVMNQDAYNSLSEEYRTIVTQKLREYSRSSTPPSEQTVLQETNWQILTPSQEFYSSLKAGATALRYLFIEDLGEEMVTSFYKVVDGE